MTSENKSSYRSERDLFRDPGLQVRRPNRSATLPQNGLAFALLCTNSEWRKLSLELNFLALLFN